MPITLSIVEDDRRTRESLQRVLSASPALRCISAFSRAEEALDQLPKDTPDVVLMDINLPGMTGVECVGKLKARLPRVQVVMFTTYEDPHLIFSALRSGASGYVLKGRPVSELIDAIQQVYCGGAPMSMRVARRVVAYFNDLQEPIADVTGLSPREEAVLRLLAKGYLYKEIAVQLGISHNTVRTYLKRIYEKLHVHSRTEAVARFTGR